MKEDFHGAFQNLLERSNKFIVAEENDIKGDLSFMCVLSIKVPLRNKCGNLFNDPRIYIYIYIYINFDIIFFVFLHILRNFFTKEIVIPCFTCLLKLNVSQLINNFLKF